MNCVKSMPLLKPQTSILWMEMFLNPSVTISAYQLALDYGEKGLCSPTRP